jgi:WD40 repeat protein
VAAAWNLATRELAALPAPVAAEGLAFSPDGLVVHAYSKYVHETYTLADRKRASLARDPAPAGVVLADTMPLPDGDAIVRRPPNLVEITGAHPRPPAALDVASTAWIAPSPDGKVLAVSDLTRVVLYDTATLARRAVLGPGRAIAFAPDSTKLALSVDDGGTIAIYDAATGARAGELVRPGGVAAVALAFSPDGAQLASSGADGVIVLQPVP